MPSSNPSDPTNYQAVVAGEDIKWHSGFGTVTYSYLSAVPSYYPLFSPGTYDVGGQAVPTAASVFLNSS